MRDEEESEADELERLDGEELRENIKERSKFIERNYVVLGRDLYLVAKGRKYKDWGFATFNEYLRHDVQMGPRKGQRLRQIWKNLLQDFKVPETTIAGCSYSNLIEIVTLIRPKILTAATAIAWVSRARTMTYDALCLEVAAAKAMREEDAEATIVPATVVGSDEIERVKSHTKRKSFNLTDDEADLIDESIRVGATDGGSDRPGHVLANICTFFMANRASDTAMKQYLLDKLTSVFGGKFIHLEDNEMIEAWEEAFADIDVDEDDEE